MVSKEVALADVKARREAVQQSIEALKARLSPEQLTENALSLLDPDLSLLGRVRSRIEHNKVLSLAVLAGVGWLVGGYTRHGEGQNSKRTAGMAQPPKTAKEKHHDSGQSAGKHWNGANETRTESHFQEDGEPQPNDWSGQAGKEGLQPVHGLQETERHSPEAQRR